MHSVDYEIRQIGKQATCRSDAEALSALHMELLGHSPLVLMGPDFMEQFYYYNLPLDGFVRGAIAFVDGKPAGFIVGTDDADGFMMRSVRKHWFKIVWVLTIATLRNPKRVLAIWEALQIQRNVSAEEYGPEVGELLSFGVLPEFRSRSFVRETGFHISQDLLQNIVRQFESTSVTRLRAIVDKDNLEAQFFYRANGWRVGLKAVKGWSVPTMEFLLDLT